MRGEHVAIAAVLLVILAGMVVAYAPPIYSHGFSAWEDEDGIHYEYSANHTMDTHTVAISSSTSYDITYLAVYYDPDGYAAVGGWDARAEMLDDLGTQLGIRSFDGYGYYTAAELLDLMKTADRDSVAILFASGALPDLLYDGTVDCPLLEWLGSGGAVVNVAGCLGKYVSTGPGDITEVSGYAELFTGVEGKSDEDFNDNPGTLRVSGEIDNDYARSLGVYLTEYSYGIRCDGMDDYISIGGTSSQGYSTAVIYRSGGGMVMNFGMTVEYQVHTLHYLAQVLAAGLDYTSEILGYESGSTSDPTGLLEGVSGDDVHVYGYIGYTRAVFGMRVNLRSHRPDTGEPAVEHHVAAERRDRVPDAVEYDEDLHDVQRREYREQDHHVREQQGVQAHQLPDPSFLHAAALDRAAAPVAVDGTLRVDPVVGVPQVHDEDHP